MILGLIWAQRCELFYAHTIDVVVVVIMVILHPPHQQ